MKVTPLALPDVLLIAPTVYPDDRGFFMETWNARAFAEAGIDVPFVQDNQSRSRRGVLRGRHYQLEQPQGKLVRVAAGRVFDVAVDIRRSSPGFGRWVGAELSAENRHMLWIPPGFAHGFMALEDGTDLLYKCTDFFAPDHDRTLLWSDPAIGIDWPAGPSAGPILSAKDQTGALLRDAEVFA